MPQLSGNVFESVEAAQKLLLAAEKPLIFLTLVDWPDEVRLTFLDNRRLPQIEYPPCGVSDSLAAVAQARKLIDGEHTVLAWLRRMADSIETTAHLIDERGTRGFFKCSKELFGEPNHLLLDEKTRVIDLARHMDATLDGLDLDKLVPGGHEDIMDATEFAERLRTELAHNFDRSAPKIELSHTMSAKASAGATYIHVRADATFSEPDVHQLLNHEIFVHTATALNGEAQPYFPILGRSHAGTTQIQEGLAVFAEMITGSMDPVRFRRLSDRVIAIQHSIDGADFNDIFDFYMDRTDDAHEAFENARRIFRGGVTTGGAPFTKDSVYLNGLLRVHNFMRSVIDLKRGDVIRLLFAGKLDLEDVPAIAQLAVSNRLAKPEFLPPWIKDMRFLVSYLAYSSFVDKVELPGFQGYYSKELSAVPENWQFMETKYPKA